MREKTKAIERKQAKLLSAEEELKDLNAEFEADRQDYLETIRTQDKNLKLYQQLLATVSPCLRRDCNYFNIDKIKGECEWDDVKQAWILPKLVLNKTVLSPPASLPKATGGGGFLERKGLKGGGNLTGSGGLGRNTSSSDPHLRGYHHHHHPMSLHTSNARTPSSSSAEQPEDDNPTLSHLQLKSDDSLDYFKPKRALELLGQHHQVKESLSPKHNHILHDPNTLTTTTSSSSSSAFPSSAAAAVHKVDALLDTNFGGGRRPGKLQSLSRNPPVREPHPFPEPEGVLEKAEKKRLTGKKNLEPLADIKTKKPQL